MMRMRWYCSFPHPVVKYEVPGGWLDVTIREGGKVTIDDWGIVIDGVCEQPAWCTEAMRIKQAKKIRV